MNEAGIYSTLKDATTQLLNEVDQKIEAWPGAGDFDYVVFDLRLKTALGQIATWKKQNALFVEWFNNVYNSTEDSPADVPSELFELSGLSQPSSAPSVVQQPGKEMDQG
jgi:hypothetical protein